MPSAPSNDSMMAWPATSSKKSLSFCHPPCSNPPLVSSSLPPGACMTPSSVRNSLTTILIGLASSLGSARWDRRGDRNSSVAPDCSTAGVELRDELLRGDQPVALLDPVRQHAERRRLGDGERDGHPSALAEPVARRLGARNTECLGVRGPELHR